MKPPLNRGKLPLNNKDTDNKGKINLPRQE